MSADVALLEAGRQAHARGNGDADIGAVQKGIRPPRKHCLYISVLFCPFLLGDLQYFPFRDMPYS